VKALRMAGLAAVVAIFCASLAPVVHAAEDPEKFGLKEVSAELSSQQAGAHADFTQTISFESEGGEAYALVKDLTIDLPPGLTGNPQAIQLCTSEQFGNLAEESECPVASQVGTAEVTTGGSTAGTFNEPIYNLKRPTGGNVVARLGFFALIYPVVVNIEVDPVDFGLVAKVEGVPAAAELLSSVTTLWGVPADPIHDQYRITPEEAVKHIGSGQSAGVPEVPFLTNPTSCGDPGEMTVTAVSYALPNKPSVKSAPMPQTVGCEKVEFIPSFTMAASNPEAAAPSGIDAELQLVQNEAPKARGTAALKSATVTLPPGFTVNPAAGDGLEACSAEEVNFEENKPAECPPAAKIGSVDIEVPALDHALHGSVYQRTPVKGDLFGFWVVADELGVHLKLPSKIEPNPLTGQLTTHFDGIPSLGGNPQFPFADLKFHFFGGPRAPVATPNTCGTYQTSFEFVPWSGTTPVKGQTPMAITTGCGKGGFNPQIDLYTRNSSAGAFSTMVFRLIRQDGEGNPLNLELTLPPGLLAKPAGVPLCPEADTASGSCPASSQIGTVLSAAGVGGAPLWLPQPGKPPTAAYWAGPYKGAPYSIVIKVPAQAGPFDLGNVITRAGIYVDPTSAVATVKSDPLPQILEGVPIAYREVRVITDRPEFSLNPTNCEVKQAKATIVSATGVVATPTDAFQANNCAKLPYGPKLSLQFKGQTKRSGNPAVKATFTQASGQANNARIETILPATEFIDQAHINNPCTRVQFNAGACPKNSILGTARAFTPLLDEPLEGPIYFRSNGGERELPDIVLDFQGKLHITLVGFIDSIHKKGSEKSRVRVTFASIPDAPLSKGVLSFYGGKKGLIENSVNLCAKKTKATVKLKAQNGKQKQLEVPLGVKCGGGKG
jgi:hypothetical protein